MRDKKGRSHGFHAVIDYNSNVLDVDEIQFFRTRKANWNLGEELIETPYGNKVRCYDKERCICDLFIRDDYDDEDRVYALNEYANGYLDISKLYRYARILGVYEKVSNVFEVIRWNHARPKVW